MLKILDPRELDQIAYTEGVLNDIKKYSLLDNNRIGWNYPMDYLWVFQETYGKIIPGMRIVDIGCGPGAIHGYLEDKYSVDIIGIDMNRWPNDYVDLVGDFASEGFRNENEFGPETVDLIVSTSAFEHVPPKEHKKLIGIIKSVLKPNGRLISTTTISPKRTRKVYPSQWDLSQNELEDVYGENLSGSSYKDVKPHYQNHIEMPELYKQRFGKWRSWYPKYLSIGYSFHKTT